MDRQVVASGRKFNLREDLRWVVKRTRKGSSPQVHASCIKKHFNENEGERVQSVLPITNWVKHLTDCDTFFQV